MPRHVAFLLIVVALLSGCSDSKDEAAPSLKAEMLVKPVHGKFLAACQTEELLNELITHSVNSEKTKFAAMFNTLDCMSIPEDEIYKILTVHSSVVEFTNSKNTNPTGMWAVIEAFQPQ